MERQPQVPSLQAYRYVCGLSQDQAAIRYNEVTKHQTTLGGTTINSWETWARRGARGGSPPGFGSLLVLARVYGAGPLGVGDEPVSPGDLVADAYERLAPEDQVALKHLANLSAPAARQPGPGQQRGAGNVIGADFTLEVPTAQELNPMIRVFQLPNPEPGLLLNLTWSTFGFGVQRLITQIKNVGARMDVDACFGINEAGLVMATFLASAEFGRCPVGYLKCVKGRDFIELDEASLFPPMRENPVIVLCDFEVKHADVVGFVSARLRERYPGAEIHFAVFGAMTKEQDLKVASFDDLTGAGIMRAAGFGAVFIAATMSPPGIEPPLELR
ncbi:MAG: hypothetical protein AUG49_20310 [Catenulispora sp. 13_1_20CM_3_70_7]|nr:MAG: hypothetical protein AUG49_20310 [Catenulispora sp. 13_1_20CM_3_70_7]